jgi:hypothetical protein
MTDHVARMFETHPRPEQSMVDSATLVRTLEALATCAQTCTACADACLTEGEVGELVRCIRLNLDCADICDTTSRVLARQTETDWDVVRGQLESCAVACRACGSECERHGEHMEHCRVCAEACRACEEACRALL